MAKFKLSAKAMMDAAVTCEPAKVRALLAAGAQQKHLATKTMNAVTEACFGWYGGYEKPPAKRLEVVRELVAAGCPVQGLALFRPIDQGERELIRFLIEHGADVNAVSDKSYYWCVNKGSTPLGLAAQLGHFEITADLIAAGADVNLGVDRKMRFGLVWPTSPLMLAAQWDQPAVIGLLAKKGAQVNAMREGWPLGTALLVAVSMRKIECVKALLAAGANPNLASVPGGPTPRVVAAQRGDPAIIELLSAAP